MIIIVFLSTKYASVVLFLLLGEDLLLNLFGNIDEDSSDDDSIYIDTHENERGYAANYRFGKRFIIFICAARGYDENWVETLGLQTDMLRYYDGQSGLPLFALAAANDDGTTEGM